MERCRILKRGWAGAALCVLAAWVLRRGLEAGETSTERSGRRLVVCWQAALDAAGFSPGLLDGLLGAKTETAIRAYQESRGLEVTGRMDEATLSSLKPPCTDGECTYAILPEDERLVSYCPADWNERSRRERLLYPTLANCLAERFHTSERCLAWLNPGKDLAALKAGDEIVVPLILKPEASRPPASLEIDLERRLVLLLDSEGRTQGLIHCSVARDPSLAVRGECAVATVVAEPGYTFDPKKWPEVKDVDRKLEIPPGPRSPVGLRWIGLDRPGVGIHGTPEPENIGKTGSHGCFRLTNWDAVYLASVVSVGTRVRIVDRSEKLGTAPTREVGTAPTREPGTAPTSASGATRRGEEGRAPRGPRRTTPGGAVPTR